MEKEVMGMKVENIESKHILKVTLNGFATTNATTNVLKNRNQVAGDIDFKEYSLLLDCSNMGVFQSDSVPILQRLYTAYMERGYKNVVFIKSKKSIQNSQLMRVAKMTAGFPGVFVDTEQEAMNICTR